jgi:hypothetical protein
VKAKGENPRRKDCFFGNEKQARAKNGCAAKTDIMPNGGAKQYEAFYRKSAFLGGIGADAQIPLAFLIRICYHNLV